MPEYLVLIYEDERQWESISPDDWAQAMQAHSDFAEKAVAGGAKIVNTRPLEPTRATTSFREGLITEGPFVETAEQLGGYYLVEARDLDHALEVGAMAPARNGHVEVRPIADLD